MTVLLKFILDPKHGDDVSPPS